MCMDVDSGCSDQPITTWTATAQDALPC
jgi:hypothetical protein